MTKKSTGPKPPLYTIMKGLITQTIDGKTVLFDNEKSILYTLNETASYIFKLIKAQTPKEKIIDRLTHSYSVTEKKARNDVGDLFKQLNQKKIISLASSA